MPGRLSAFFLVALGSAFSIAFFVTLKLHYDNLQILDKAIALVDHGRWTHVGNRATGVGYVPGTFQTAITALPMTVWFSPYAALAVVGLFHLASFGLLALVVRDLGRPALFLDLALLYWVNPWRVEQSQLYNPAFLFLFAALHFWTAYRMRDRSFGLTLGHVLAVGFCAQVHFSFVILAILSVLLWWFRYLRVHWGGFAVGVGLLGVSLIPYAMAYFVSPGEVLDLGGGPGRFPGLNLVLVFPVLKALGYWIRYGSTFFARPLFSEVDLGWLATGLSPAVVSATFAAVKWPMAVVTVSLSGLASLVTFVPVWRSRPFRRGVDRTGGAPADRIALYAFYALAATLLTAGLSPVQFVHWHLLLCFPIVATLVTIRFNALRDRLPPRRIALAFSVLLAVFVVFNTLGFIGSRNHAYGADFHRDFMAYYQATRGPAPPPAPAR